MTAHIVLTGAYAGMNITLNNRTFVRGRLRLDGPLSGFEGLIAYYAAAYNGYLEGSEELLKAQERDRRNGTGNHQTDRLGQGDGTSGGLGQSAEGMSSDGGHDGAASGDDPLVGRATGDSGAALNTDAAASFANAKTAKLKAVLVALDPQNDEHWTQAGLPAIMAVEQAYGQTGVIRKDLEAIMPGWNRDKAIAEVTNPTAA